MDISVEELQVLLEKKNDMLLFVLRPSRELWHRTLRFVIHHDPEPDSLEYTLLIEEESHHRDRPPTKRSTMIPRSLLFDWWPELKAVLAKKEDKNRS